MSAAADAAPRVVLVGGGPGDAGLMTVAGRDAIEQADVVLVDNLAPAGALRWARPDAEVINVAKLPRGATTPQKQINELLIEHALAGRYVVRLKGGDGFVFGRGMEEVVACAQANVSVRVIPGVTSATAVPAVAGVPVTHRGVVQGFTVISGHIPPDHPDSTLDYRALVASGTTLVIMMGVRTLPAITGALLNAGMDPATPAVVIQSGATDEQRVLAGTVATIAEDAERTAIAPPVITVIGEVAGFTSQLPSEGEC